MRLRIRAMDGVVRELGDEDRFVELVGDDGKLAALVYAAEGGGAEIVLPDDEKQARHYERIFGVEFAKEGVIRKN